MTRVDVGALVREMASPLRALGFEPAEGAALESELSPGIRVRLEVRDDGRTHDDGIDGVAEDDPSAIAIRRRLDADGSLCFPVVSLRHSAVHDAVSRFLPEGFEFPTWATVSAALGSLSGMGRYRWASTVRSRLVAEDIVEAYAKWGRPWVDFAASPEGLLRVARFANGPTSRFVAPLVCVLGSDPGAARAEIEYQLALPVQLRPEVSTAFAHFAHALDAEYSLGVRFSS